jgi:hypothetical protein
MPFDLDDAHRFVEAIDLSGIPRPPIAQGAGAAASTIFDGVRQQAQVVGSGLLSFATGVTSEMRQAISDSALLAQLHANKQTAPGADPRAWFDAYLDVLANVGWVMQGLAWNDYSTKGVAAEVDEHIIEVLQAALGPGAAALAIVDAAIKALKGMQPDTSWLQIFSRESEHAQMARFQIGLVQPGEADDLRIDLLACLIKANKTLTQVLFFKFRKASASFEANSAAASLNKVSVAALQPAIQSKVLAYQAHYVSSVIDI